MKWQRFLTIVLAFFIFFAAPNQTMATPAATAQALRVEPVGTLRIDSDTHTPWWNYLVPVGSALLTGLMTLAGAWLGLRLAQNNTLKTIEALQKTSDAALWQKANESELEAIQDKLDRFYFPFLQLSLANHQFAQDLRQRQPDKEYRLLKKLFDTEWRNALRPADKKARSNCVRKRGPAAQIHRRPHRSCA